MVRRVLIGFLFLFVIAGGASAQSCGPLPDTLTNGQPADASQVMANFNTILNCINGNHSVATAGGNVNKFRNGTMDVWQRGITGLSATASLGKPCVATADGWCVMQTGAVFSCSQGSGNGGPLFALQCAGGLGNTDTQFTQRIESYIAAPLAGNTVTVQFQYKQTGGSTTTPKISSCYASATDNFTTCTSDLVATSVTSCATATWCTEAYTFTVSANATQGYAITLDCNTPLTAAQACAITAADVRVTTGVATGVNSSPPPAELRPIWTELAACQRYFETSYGNGIAPGTVTGFTGSTTIITVLATTPLSITGVYVPFSTPKRAVPTVTMYSSNSGTAGNVYDAVSSVDVAAALIATGARGFSWYASLHAAGSNSSIFGHFAATAEL
jgi:hypothetical protein